MKKLDQAALDLLFNDARTYNDWQDKSVDDALLVKLYDLVKMAPTSANCQPMRVSFVTSDEAKQRLKPCLMEGNVEKTMNAPVVAIIAMDEKFYNHLPKLFPHADAKSWFDSDEAAAKDAAYRNSTLQGGYFILAARALGLDCGPMSGFDADALDKEFFAGTSYKSNFLCNLGYGDDKGMHPRSPRPEFADFCEVI